MEQNNEISYQQALAELERIVKELQNDATDVDTMVARTRRAAELLALCRQRLTTTETELRTVLASLQQQEG